MSEPGASMRNTWCDTDDPRAASAAYSCANRASSAGSRLQSPSDPKTSRHGSL